ncbi:MAG TPA: DNRLRE domain-containing protein [Edaphobacter sp.]
MLSAVVWLALSGVAQGIEAPLVADAHVNSARPDANSGAISNLNVGAGYTSLVQFDLGVLPAGTTSSQVSRALLRLYCNRADIPGLVSIQPVTSAWGEYSVTYSSLPTFDAPVQVAGVTSSGTFVWIDVTAQVQRWITAPASNNGLAITAGSASVQFDSKENDLTGHAPALDISLVSQGPKGDTGTTGPQGPPGVSGPVGPAGSVGATGPQGPQGLQGLQGAQGIQGLPGPKGDIGATGPAGSAGATGPIGPSGPTGLQGPQGPQGPAGSPGLVYRGTYDSTANYNLGDVVLWQGTSYASLASSNYGNTPSSSPSYWGVLSAQGPAGVQGVQGPKGDTGAQGPIGATGPSGERGPQGEQGIAGQAGAQGIPGAQGAQGLQGPMGPQGPAGPAGMTFRGAYSSTTNYALGDGVTYGASGYVSLVDANHGNTPDQSPSAWAVFATGVQGQAGAAGAPGAQGLAGPQGPAGPQGEAGPQGATGPQGPAVANYTGNYTSTTNYARNDAVSYDGSTYISLVAGNVGQTPSSSPTYWAVLAAQGPAGAAGAAGPQGAAGPVGPAGTPGAMGPQGPPVSFRGDWLIITNYALGDAVSYGGGSYIALVANSGRRPDVSPVYWGVLAQPGIAGAAGATGAQGPQGQQGPAGISYKGTWSAQMGYVANDAVFYNGSTYLALATSLAAPPDTSFSAWAMLAQAGVMGVTGPAGAAATVAIGTVTTGAAGTQATVTNSGSPSAVVLNFVIPQGEAGTSGPAGGTGGETSGIPFMSLYHSVSFNTIFYSVNNSNSSADESESILTWIPSGCTATKLSVFSRQSNTITVTLRAGALGAIANTALSCSVSPNSSCTSTGTAVVPADGFLDFAISGASGTPAGVWTAVLCN